MQLPPVIAAAIAAGDTVITSSARAARNLRRLYGEAQRSRGLAAWQSADILDWDSWLLRLWNENLRSGAESRLLLTTLQEQQVWARLIKPSIEGRRLISVDSVSDLAQQAYGLLCEYRALDFLQGERASGSDVENFRDWAKAFERECRREAWLSRGMLLLVLREALQAATLRAPNDLVLAGFDRATPAQQDLVETLRQQGVVIAWAESADAPPAETTQLVEAVDKRDELITCALWLRRQLTAATGQVPRIAVVAPGAASVRAEMERIFRHILAPSSVNMQAPETPLPFEFSLGVPLAGIPMVRAALLLLRWLLEPLPQDQVTWLMLSGFLWETESDLLPMALFDSRLRRQTMLPPEQELETYLRALKGSWIEARPLSGLASRLEDGWRAFRRSSQTSGETLGFASWVERTQSILHALGGPARAPSQAKNSRRWPNGHSYRIS